jgi:hypothetical protein
MQNMLVNSVVQAGTIRSARGSAACPNSTDGTMPKLSAALLAALGVRPACHRKTAAQAAISAPVMIGVRVWGLSS